MLHKIGIGIVLGHANLQSTEIYLRADPTEKLEALTAIPPLTVPRGRFSAPDKLIAKSHRSIARNARSPPRT